MGSRSPTEPIVRATSDLVPRAGPDGTPGDDQLTAAGGV